MHIMLAAVRMSVLQSIASEVDFVLFREAFHEKESAVPGAFRSLLPTIPFMGTSS